MSKYDELVRKLKEIFQIDKPELDFGIYRILNARAAEINDYLENRLRIKIHELLLSAGTANFDQIQKELQEAEKNATDLGVSPDSVPKVQELRRKIEEVNVRSAEYENAVFTHLLNFFSRYYDSGDFISKRRYKGDTYSIPYGGEEVLLHWSNKDQYYIKNGENFSNYAFKLDDGRRVCFNLIAADTVKDNCKDNERDRYFVLIKPHTRIFVDGDEEHEEKLLPVEEINGELILRFEYKPLPKGSKQEALILDAVNMIMRDAHVNSGWSQLFVKEKTDKNPQCTLLEKHLTNYTIKNTADYFIHKDLGYFLRGELDFYIKNEVIHLDDIQNAKKFSDIEKNLSLIQTIRTIALDLIAFLAQLEDFQKKLWLKKKFVVSSHYCMTLDRVPERFYPKIAANEKQWEQWEKLGMLNDKIIEVDNMEYIKAHPYLMIDTELFDLTFKYELLATIENLDEELDGLLIHGDNFQALNLLQARYRSKIDCVHIDPPYNTGSSGFLYKNGYSHSSWLSLMQSRIEISTYLMSENACFQCHIDEYEYESLHKIFNNFSFPFLGTIIWDKRNPMMGGKGLAVQHEFIIWCSNQLRQFEARTANIKIILEKAATLIKANKGVNETSRKEFAKWVKNHEGLTGGERAYQYLECDGRVYRHVAMTWPNPNPAPPQFFIPLIHPITKKECALPTRGWSRTPEKMQELICKNEIVFGKDETVQPQRKIYLTNDSRRPMASIIQNGQKGKADLEKMGLEFSYCHPIHLYEEIIYGGLLNSSGIVLDYFAGSGTAGHAVINLNREDKGCRKYILVEQGNYFNTVLKPRIQKVVYSPNWKNGRPNDLQMGVSHAFKFLKIESYEDTLNNLHLHRSKRQQNFLDTMPIVAKEDYLLRYLLNIESRGTLLSVENFNKPFDCKLKVSVDSVGAYDECQIDLIETFNYLIGLNVKHIDIQRDQGFAKVVGWLPTGEYILILWRDTELVNYQTLNELCDKYGISPAVKEFDVVYINGDHNIPSVITSNNDEGGVTQVLKLRQIEPEFMKLMFAEEVV
ncbi:TPA: site-specific DNA-methyltransferase [Legionella pneumophila]|nr:site-specific DNA-methyltransferase [Legionella pneumophila]